MITIVCLQLETFSEIKYEDTFLTEFLKLEKYLELLINK